jgi:hypothetical protein
VEKAQLLARVKVELTLFHHFDESKFSNPLYKRIYAKMLQTKPDVRKFSLKATQDMRSQFRVRFFLF